MDCKVCVYVHGVSRLCQEARCEDVRYAHMDEHRMCKHVKTPVVCCQSCAVMHIRRRVVHMH